MEIHLNEISVREVCDGFVDNDENGVFGYHGKLNIRPAFQREFIYDDSKRDAVINTIQKGFPLNVMYWVDNLDGNYELLDGQQRTISICYYVAGYFSINGRAFHNLTKSEQEQILDYKLMIYICNGTDKEKLDWFKTINIAGIQLTKQELRNAIYTGPWLHDAKRHFSKTGAPAYKIGKNYLTGSAIRQDYLETALKWISSRDGISIEDYMSKHQHDPIANELWSYFQDVINWVSAIFPDYDSSIMKGVDWGTFYNAYHQDMLDPKELKKEVEKLKLDDDVTAKKGICPYLLSHDPKYLSLRAFTDSQKLQVYTKQKGICPICVEEHRPKTHYELNEMEADHITPWIEGGHTTIDNCQMLCKEHNRRKGSN